MAIVNTIAQEITAKIVYYGPGLCGKTTNLQSIHEMIAPELKGRLISLATQQDRTLFFDLMALEADEKIKGFKLRYQLYTVPGQVFYNASRNKVLQGADGVVFVADSTPNRSAANEQSMQNLYDNLISMNIDPLEIPMVLQYNKRDCQGAISINELEEKLNPQGVPAIIAVAKEGIGVFETLGEILRKVDKKLRK